MTSRTTPEYSRQYYLKNKERIKEYQLKNKDKIQEYRKKEYQTKEKQEYQDRMWFKEMESFRLFWKRITFRKYSYYYKNKTKCNLKSLEYQRDPKNVLLVRERKRRYEVNRKIRIYNHYSNYDIKCNCCGERHIEFITLDHINNDGAAHRKVIGLHLHRWVLKNNFPPGFQLLCFNCNWNKAHDREHICIHQRELAKLELSRGCSHG